MFANISNYYCFRSSEDDAKKLVGNLQMEFPVDVVQAAQEKGVDEKTMSTRMITNLHPRECIVRVAAGGKLLPCFKAKTVYIDSDSSTDQETITVQTHVDKHQVLQAYEGEITDISSFLERADSLPAGTAIDIPTTTESPPAQPVATNEPLIETTTSLDDIMTQTSSKDHR